MMLINSIVFCCFSLTWALPTYRQRPALVPSPFRVGIPNPDFPRLPPPVRALPFGLEPVDRVGDMFNSQFVHPQPQNLLAGIRNEPHPMPYPHPPPPPPPQPARPSGGGFGTYGHLSLPGINLQFGGQGGVLGSLLSPGGFNSQLASAGTLQTPLISASHYVGSNGNLGPVPFPGQGNEGSNFGLVGGLFGGTRQPNNLASAHTDNLQSNIEGNGVKADFIPDLNRNDYIFNPAQDQKVVILDTAPIEEQGVSRQPQAPGFQPQLILPLQSRPMNQILLTPSGSYGPTYGQIGGYGNHEQGVFYESENHSGYRPNFGYGGSSLIYNRPVIGNNGYGTGTIGNVNNYETEGYRPGVTYGNVIPHGANGANGINCENGPHHEIHPSVGAHQTGVHNSGGYGNGNQHISGVNYGTGSPVNVHLSAEGQHPTVGLHQSGGQGSGGYINGNQHISGVNYGTGHQPANGVHQDLAIHGSVGHKENDVKPAEVPVSDPVKDTQVNNADAPEVVLMPTKFLEEPIAVPQEVDEALESNRVVRSGPTTPENNML